MSSFDFDGGTVSFRPGQTLGAALMAQGIVSWRSTRINKVPRGLFCGIGVCFDCLLVIDGVPNQRACLAVPRDGMRVSTQEGTGHDDQAV